MLPDLPLGWTYYTIHQGSDAWRCTLRHEAALVSYGQGPTLDSAIDMALDGLDRAKPVQAQAYMVDRRALDLTALLNLRPQLPAIKRRI